MSTPPTDLPAADSQVVETSVSSTAQRATALNAFSLLVRREFWEYRALWMAPVVVAGLLVAAALVAAIMIHVELIDFGRPEGALTGQQFNLVKMMEMQQAVSAPLYLVAALVLNFYLLDCLYTERKDRSILFWKSMPVSDAATVLSKLVAAMVVVPFGVYVLAMVSSLALAAIMSIRLAVAHLHPVGFSWSTVAFLKAQVLMLLTLTTAVLWYAPLAGYLLLISAWARRTVFLWATLPPVVGVVLERLVFSTHYLSDLIEYRVEGPAGSGGLHDAMHSAVSASNAAASLQMGFAQFGHALMNIDLWLGLAVAAGFVFFAARLRRYRDDT